MSLLSQASLAPDFTLPDQDGIMRTLSEYRGQYVVVYFYPKDDTPGCTKEACGIRDNYGRFRDLNVQVFGVSKDSQESHKKFIEKYSLPFTLLSDPSKEMIETWGGTSRISYLIDPEGNVAKVYPKVSPAEHAEEILADIGNM